MPPQRRSGTWHAPSSVAHYLSEVYSRRAISFNLLTFNHESELGVWLIYDTTDLPDSVACVALVPHMTHGRCYDHPWWKPARLMIVSWRGEMMKMFGRFQYHSLFPAVVSEFLAVWGRWQTDQGLPPVLQSRQSQTWWIILSSLRLDLDVNKTRFPW